MTKRQSTLREHGILKYYYWHFSQRHQSITCYYVNLKKRFASTIPILLRKFNPRDLKPTFPYHPFKHLSAPSTRGTGRPISDNVQPSRICSRIYTYIPIHAHTATAASAQHARAYVPGARFVCQWISPQDACARGLFWSYRFSGREFIAEPFVHTHSRGVKIRVGARQSD